MNTIQVPLYVNGSSYLLSTPAARTLLDVLREDLGLTGAKDACGGEGECGACTVLMDGAPVNSCMVLIGQADGHQIETIEGFSQNGELHPIQKAFVEAGAVQCGYCTPGAVIAAKALLDRVVHPSDEQIREAMAGNLCRCTGYSKILDAVHIAVEEINHDR
jgi:aerobic-type carbon monoxide dehydrogenase small subunit (CoxS/CutS family)